MLRGERCQHWFPDAPLSSRRVPVFLGLGTPRTGQDAGTIPPSSQLFSPPLHLAHCLQIPGTPLAEQAFHLRRPPLSPRSLSSTPANRYRVTAFPSPLAS